MHLNSESPRNDHNSQAPSFRAWSDLFWPCSLSVFCLFFLFLFFVFVFGLFLFLLHNTLEVYCDVGSVLTDEGSKTEIPSKITQTTEALTRFKPVWNNRSISLSSKIRLMCFLFTPSSCIHVNHAELQRRMQAMEMRCYCKILYSSYKDHVTNEEVCEDTAGNRTARRPPYYRKETQTEVVRTCLPFLRFQNHLARHSERGKKTRQA